MRLGDLDALKEDFKSRLADCNEWIEKAKDKETKIRASAIKAFIGEVIMTIDNAPTVDIWQLRQEATENALKKAEVLYGRPQGEWEHWGSPFSDEQVVNSIVCSVCGARFVEIQDEVFNFCPNCGAKMKGGAE